MAKKVSTTVIGGFVISALVLLLMAVILFGSGSFGKHTQQYVLFFKESVKGLGVGSPVMFRGVEIGKVKSIVLQVDHDQIGVHVPVTIDIDEKKFIKEGGHRPDVRTHFDRLIKRGLRGQLDMQSLVTGQLLIQLDFQPDTPVKLSGRKNKYREIPTVPSSLEKLTSTLKNLPIKKIADNVLHITDRVNTLLNDGRVDQIIDGIDDTVANTDKLVIKVDNKADELLARFITLEKSITVVADDATRLLTNVNQEVQPLSRELSKSLKAAKKALDQADVTLATVNDFVDRSDTRVKLNRALDEIASGARSLGELAEYLERHPEALLKGKSRRGN